MRSRAAALPVAVACLAVLAAACYWLGAPQMPPDFVYWWTAGRALLHGKEPYAAVLALGLGYPFYYPLPAAIATAPFALLPLLPAHLAFAGVSGFAYAKAGPRLGPGVLAGALSACFMASVSVGHWPPLLMVGAAFPWLAWLWAVKPSTGLAWFAGYPSRPAVIGGVLLVALSLVLRHDWPGNWLQAIRGGPHYPLILRPGGFVLLLAFVRWRDPRARVLGVLAVVPQVGTLYDALPVFLAARTRWEGYGLAVLSWVVAFGQFHVLHSVRLSFPEEAAHGWPWLLLGLYLPALALVLRPSVAYHTVPVVTIPPE